MDREALIAEYTLLKEELNNISNNQNTLFIFVFSAVGAVLSFALQDNCEYIPLICFFVLICVRCRIIYYRDVYFKKLIYLRKIIEPKLKLDSNIQRNIKIFGISKIQYFSFSFMAIGSLLAVLRINASNLSVIFVAVALTIIIIGLDSYYLFAASSIYRSIEKQFMNIWKNHHIKIN